MKMSRTPQRAPARTPAAARERPTSNVFRSFVRTLEKLESARAAGRPAREDAR